MTACEKTQKGERHGPHRLKSIPGTIQDSNFARDSDLTCLGFPPYEELVAEVDRLRHETLTPEHVSDLLKAQYQPIKERAERAEARVKELEADITKLFPHIHEDGDHCSLTKEEQESYNRAKKISDKSSVPPTNDPATNNRYSIKCPSCGQIAFVTFCQCDEYYWCEYCDKSWNYDGTPYEYE